MTKLQPVRGTKDLYGEDAQKFQHIIDTASRVSQLYGFQPFHTPIFEFTEVFKRTLGETSDVVNKEMYSFEDRGGESLTLRPEFTAGIARAFISNGMQQNLPVKAFSYGPLFRYERPQKGRQRQFHQINFEWLGEPSPYADVEMILMAAILLHELGILPKVKLLINTLGDAESRQNYSLALVDYLKQHKEQLSDDSKKRLELNPLRILDSKDEGDKALVANAPKIQDYLTPSAKEFFDTVWNEVSNVARVGETEFINIEQKDIPPEYLFEYDQEKLLVRGLDYYTHTVFEFVGTTDDVGAQNTVLAGGRYDGLIEQMGGSRTSAIGFAAGIERLALLSGAIDKKKKDDARPIAVILFDDAKMKTLDGIEMSPMFYIGNAIRKHVHVPVQTIFTSNMGKGFKKADKLHATHTVIVGENEILKREITIKNMETGEQQTMSFDKGLLYLKNERKQ